ncbi:glutaredoxin family protein [Luteimonas sp. SX5]|uniref:Glutaredoxin family protein n=1 Tax=Luteimonas galliterrae TaxID=2940486 RepID=A0ABT0MIM4_9GAMM|nr:glutaredoxin family protein [Luteimonas galliterrae]MCL1634717.1 glutaredoxin family protein [Luteimonas galliterrae]
MLARAFINTGVVAVFLVGGFLLGSNLRRTYDRLFPEPDYVIGNYEELYDQAAKPVVIFSTSICKYCQYARELLRHENVAYQDFVIDKSADARRKFEALDGSGVPMLFIGNRRIVGFRENVIRDSLACIRQ